MDFLTVFPTERTLTDYASLCGDLRTGSRLIGPHDLWVAASALEFGIPLLTRNTRGYGRVPGLQLVDYSQAET